MLFASKAKQPLRGLWQGVNGWREAYVQGRSVARLGCGRWQRCEFSGPRQFMPAPREGGSIARLGNSTLIIGGWTARYAPPSQLRHEAVT